MVALHPLMQQFSRYLCVVFVFIGAGGERGGLRDPFSVSRRLLRESKMGASPVRKNRRTRASVPPPGFV